MARGICEHRAKLLYIVLFLIPKNRPKPRLGAISSIPTEKSAFPGFGSILALDNHRIWFLGERRSTP